MAEYNVQCMACYHGPHRDKKCADCDCHNFLRCDIQAARALTNINNFITNYGPMVIENILNLVDILCVMNPGVEEKVKARREEAMAKLKEEQNAKAKTINTAADGSRTEHTGDDDGTGELGLPRSEGLPDACTTEQISGAASNAGDGVVVAGAFGAIEEDDSQGSNK